MTRWVVARVTFGYPASRPYNPWGPTQDVPGGVIAQGTHMRADDPIVKRYPEQFADLDAPPDTLAPATEGRTEPIATPEQAEAAYAEHGSEREAARALGVSKTHLRRLLGKDD